MNSLVFLECKCPVQGKYRLKFDGGSQGFYTVDVCPECIEQEDREFLVSETKFSLSEGGYTNE